MVLPRDFAFLAAWTSTAWPILADAAIKGTILLCLAGITTLAMRRASAAQRHCAWLLAVGGVLMLPLLAALLPAWRILPQWPNSTSVALNRDHNPSASLAPRPGDRRLDSGPRHDLAGARDDTLLPFTDAAHSVATLATAESPTAQQPAAPPPIVTSDLEPPTIAATAGAWCARFHLAEWTLAVWTCGVAALLFRYVVGLLLLWRAGRESRPVDCELQQALLRQVAETFTLRRPVVLLESSERTIPMTWGIAGTVVLVPAEARNWPVERQRVVLAHELAHVKRRDCLAQLVTQVAIALYWFNPLVWLARRRLLAESERACDDLVLAQGAKASEYAEHLLTVATGAKVGRLVSAAAIAMARSSDLTRRLPAILDPRCNRRRVTRLGVLLATVVLLAVTIPLAIAQQSTEKAAAETSKAPRAATSSTAEASTGKADEKSAATTEEKTESHSSKPAAQSSPTATTSPDEPPPPLLSAHGTVVDPAGKPVAGATVYLREWSIYRVLMDAANRTPLKDRTDILATTQTDAEGAYRYENVPAKPLREEWLKQIPWDVVVVAKPYGMGWRHLNASQQAGSLDVKLTPEATVSGRVTDQQGHPVQNALVSLHSIDPLDSDWPCTAYSDPGSLIVQQSQLMPASKTDADGRVTFTGLPRDARLYFDVTHPDFRRNSVLAAITDRPTPDIEVFGSFDGTASKHMAKIYSGPFSVTLVPPLPAFTGRIIAADTKKPLAGVRIGKLSGGANAVTDQEGQFALKEVLDGRHRVRAVAPKGGDYLGRVLFINVPRQNAETPVNIELDRGYIVLGSVIDEKTGHGVPGVTVGFYTELDVNSNAAGGPVPVGDQTDNQGHFRLIVPAGKGTVRIRGPVQGYDLPRPSGRPKNIDGFFREVEVIAGKPIAEVKFTVRRTASKEEKPLERSEDPLAPPIGSAKKTVYRTVEGTVVDPDGKPVAGAEVGPAQWFKNVGRPERPVRTDKEGRFLFRVAPESLVDAVVVALDKQRRLRGHVPLPAKRQGNGANTPLEIRLARTGIIRGYVAGGKQLVTGIGLNGNTRIRGLLNGQPIAGASVQLSEYVRVENDPAAALIVTNRDWAETDENGQFAFPFVEADRRVEMSVYVDGYTRDDRQAQVAVGSSLEVDPISLIRLDKLVAGTVVDPDGNPVEGVEINVDMQSGMSIPSAFSKRPTGKDGHFVIRGVPDVPLTITAFIRSPDPKDNRTRMSAQVEAEPGQTDVRIVLDPQTPKQ